jgi:hypothetical protein
LWRALPQKNLGSSFEKKEISEKFRRFKNFVDARIATRYTAKKFAIFSKGF